MSRAEPKDLIVLVADKNQEYALHGLLNRAADLGIRVINYECKVHPHHDPGCLREAPDFLGAFLRRFRYAAVLLDHEGSGREQVRPEDLETGLEDLLRRNGWDDRACAVVIEPELETWVFHDLPVVEKILGWSRNDCSLRDWSEERGLWAPGRVKPSRPKETLEEALRFLWKPRSSAIYRDIAASADLRRCADRAFRKFVDSLRSWFSASG